MNLRPHPFILASTDHGPMIVNRLDRAPALEGGHYGVGHQLLTTGVYDPEEISLIRSILWPLAREAGRKIVAIDCGANIGVHTLAMAEFVGTRGHVVAFEAQERLFYALCGNIALNNLFNVSAFNIALSNTEGTMNIPRPNYLAEGSFGSLELRYSETAEHIGQTVSYVLKDAVPVKTDMLDNIVQSSVDFIKIDVEGMELEVLRGAARILDKCHPTLVVEWIKTGAEPIQTYLKGFGYSTVEIGPNLLCNVD